MHNDAFVELTGYSEKNGKVHGSKHSLKEAFEL
jgi:hypothetical protein